MKTHKALLATMLLALVSLFFSTSCTYRTCNHGHQGPPPNTYYAPGKQKPKKAKKPKKQKAPKHKKHHHDEDNRRH